MKRSHCRVGRAGHSQGTIGTCAGDGASVKPPIRARFHRHNTDCAQNCAYSIAAISMKRSVEQIVDSGVSVPGDGFSVSIIMKSPSLDKSSRSASACVAYTYRCTVRWPRG